MKMNAVLFIMDYILREKRKKSNFTMFFVFLVFGIILFYIVDEVS